MEKPSGKILDFTVNEWDQLGAAAGRTARAARFRKGLPVVIEVGGVSQPGQAEEGEQHGEQTGHGTLHNRADTLTLPHTR